MTKRRKKRSKSVILDDRMWVKSTDVKDVREEKLRKQGGNCAIHGNPPDKPVLDHSHMFYEDNCDINPYNEAGRVRGVLESDVNLLEGRYLKLYQKARIQEKYEISFPDLLINMGEYLKLDNSQEKFHYMYVTEMRKKVKYWRKDYLLLRLKEDYNLAPDNKTLMEDLVQLYMQYWVYEVERIF